jgi:hypothetical protein
MRNMHAKAVMQCRYDGIPMTPAPTSGSERMKSSVDVATLTASEALSKK